LEAYLTLTPQDLWNTDLDAFLEEWEALLLEDEQKEAGNKPRKKGAVIRTRKSIGKPAKRKDDDDDDDFAADYKPKKVTSAKRESGEEAKPRVAASKAKIAAAAAAFAASSDDEDEPPARNRINLTKKESDDEMVVDGPGNSVGKSSEGKAPAKKKIAAKRKRYVNRYYERAITYTVFFPFPSSEEMTAADSDDGLYAKPAPKKLKTEGKQTTMDGFLAPAAPKPAGKSKAPAKKATAAKGKKKATDSDDENSLPASSGGGSPVAAPPPKPRTARAAAVKKPAYVDLSDEEDGGAQG
jgi:DNA topoisomerase-2